MSDQNIGVPVITKDEFLAQTEKEYKDLYIKGKRYRLQSLDEDERSEYEIQLQTKKGFAFEKARRLFLCKCLVNENGARLLADEEEEKLKKIHGGITGLLYSEAQKLCGYEKDEIEEITKNSEKAAG
jgi:hypothetical protein